MSCTESLPCCQPALRWVHSELCRRLTFIAQPTVEELARASGAEVRRVDGLRRSGKTFRALLVALLRASEVSGEHVGIIVHNAAVRSYTVRQLRQLTAEVLVPMEVTACPRPYSVMLPNGSTVEVLTVRHYIDSGRFGARWSLLLLDLY